MPLKGLTPGTFASFPSPRLISGGGSNIKSLQHGSVVMSALTIDVTLGTAVDLTKAIVKISIGTGAASGYNPSSYLVGAALTTTTNLQLKINDFTTNVTVYWEVIEFNNVRTLQTGILAVGGTSVTQAITSVNLAKSTLFFSLTSTSASTSFDNCLTSGVITNATLLTFTQVGTASKSVYWQVIEFN